MSNGLQHRRLVCESQHKEFGGLEMLTRRGCSDCLPAQRTSLIAPRMCPSRETLILEGGLVVIELEIGKVGQVDREIKGEVPVGIPYEVEAGPPLMQLTFQPHDL